MIKGLKAMLAHGDDDICIEDAIRQIEHHVDCIVQDPSYEIPKICIPASTSSVQGILPKPSSWQLRILSFFCLRGQAQC